MGWGISREQKGKPGAFVGFIRIDDTDPPGDLLIDPLIDPLIDLSFRPSAVNSSDPHRRSGVNRYPIRQLVKFCSALQMICGCARGICR